MSDVRTGRLAERAAPAILDVIGVRKRYGDTPALNGVDLRIEPGEIVALLGRNGAGKTTLMSIVAGVLPADGGTVRVAGLDSRAHGRRTRALTGFAPQELALYPTLTVTENLRFAARLRGLPRDRVLAAIERCSALLALEDLMDRPVRTLSGGQARRVHTAVALLGGPPLLLLDEPTAGADVPSRSAVVAAVRELAAEGAAVCYCTHYLTEVEELDPAVLVLHEGTVAARGSVRELVARHAVPSVELEFHGPPPRIDVPGAVVHGSRVRVPAADPPAAAAGLLAELGEAVRNLRALDLVRPTLEAAFLALTGTPAPAAEGET